MVSPARSLARNSIHSFANDRELLSRIGASSSFVKLDVGSSPVGTGATAHYFFAQAYNFKLTERWISDMLAKQVHDIFLEDMAMVRAQQQNMDLGPCPVVNLGQDKAGSRCEASCSA
jgi:vanillate O-demethylase oxygenase-like protein